MKSRNDDDDSETERKNVEREGSWILFPNDEDGSEFEEYILSDL